MGHLGRTRCIVNPASHNGEGAQGAVFARSVAASAPESFDSFEIVSTTQPGHATDLARDAAGCDTVLVVGGDGVVHEVLQGLMALPEDTRPRLALIPFGNGNDFARTLGMSFDYQKAIDQILEGREQRFDVGVCNDVFFIETLSFGLDAAIALGTEERRRRTGETGTTLFVREGFNQLAFHRDIYDYRIALDDGEPADKRMYLLAVQNGPTYGGGFPITPDADPTDGVLDLCAAFPPIGVRKAFKLFLSAKKSQHTSMTDALEFMRASRIRLDFDREPAVQADGERVTGVHFDIAVRPRELRVVTAVPR
jgi:YegS/Rv2252/BmrU family lipid kinase